MEFRGFLPENLCPFFLAASRICLASRALLLVTAKAICFKETLFFAFLAGAFFAALLGAFLATFLGAFLGAFFTAFLAVFFAAFRAAFFFTVFRFAAAFFFAGRPRLAAVFFAGRPRRLPAAFFGLRPRRLAGAVPAPPKAASISASLFSASAAVACAFAKAFDRESFSDCNAARARWNNLTVSLLILFGGYIAPYSDAKVGGYPITNCLQVEI